VGVGIERGLHQQVAGLHADAAGVAHLIERPVDDHDRIRVQVAMARHVEPGRQLVAPERDRPQRGLRARRAPVRDRGGPPSSQHAVDPMAIWYTLAAMTYRDDREADRARIAALEQELAAARDKVAALEGRQSQALVLASQGALVRGSSDGAIAKWFGAPANL